MRLCSSSTSIIEDRESLSAFEYFDHTRPAIVAEQRDTEIRLQLGDETAKKTPVISRNQGVHGFLRAIWSGEKLYYTQQNGTLTGGLTMRVIQRGAASLGEGVLRDFARSLQRKGCAPPGTRLKMRIWHGFHRSCGLM